MNNSAIDPLGTRQTGVSLVELMLTLVIGLFLTASVINIFLATKQTNRMQEALSQLQENGRLAMHELTARLRMAGYSGCYGDLSSEVENILNNPTGFAWDLANTAQGYDNVAANANIGGITGFVVGTDVLVVKGMSDGVPLSANLDTSTLTIDAANNRFNAGEILLVTDCDRASLFQATAVTTAGTVTTIAHASGSMTPGNNLETVSNRFISDAEIGRLTTFMYYIKNYANGRPSLYEARLAVTGGNTAALQEEELIPNVENMQIVFGVDTDADRDADVYQNASAVTNWRNVLSVRIALLLISAEDNLVSGKQSYSFNAGTFTYTRDSTPTANADRRLRRVFTGFGTLRNRTL
jgi:type IV pilus assembly protein PilW